MTFLVENTDLPSKIVNIAPQQEAGILQCNQTGQILLRIVSSVDAFVCEHNWGWICWCENGRNSEALSLLFFARLVTIGGLFDMVDFDCSRIFFRFLVKMFLA